ncbi:uncharacterized protein VB005_09379 [Metarhizium brunneum]
MVARLTMLSTTPEEILLAIASHLRDPTDLMNLSYCCRQFHHCLLPAAYSSLRFNNHCIWKLSCLVHTLVRNASLSAAVRHLALGAEFTCSHGLEACDIKYEAAVIRPVLQATGYPEQELKEWESDLRNGQREDPWLAIMLPFLPNLQSLALKFEDPWTRVPRLLERGLGVGRPSSSSLLSQVTEISTTITGCELERDGVPTSDCLLFFSLPSLERLRGQGIIDCDEDDEPPPEAFPHSGLATITDIDLRMSNSPSGMQKLVHACTKLESFYYEHEIAIGGCDEFNPAAFHASLLRHKGTLQKLILVFNKQDDFRPGEDGENDFFGSLSPFSVLKEVRLRAPNLLGLHTATQKPQPRLIDTLPSSLVRLTLEDVHQCDMRVLIVELEECILNAPCRLPCINTLVIEGHIHEYDAESANSTPPGHQPIPVIERNIIKMTQKLRLLCQDISVNFRFLDREIESAIAYNREIEEEEVY